MKPSSLYLHIPFCKQKCLYCDFPSFSDCDRLFEPYTNSLISELKEGSSDCSDTSIKTIFMGGGTPTLLPTTLLGKIMDTVFSKYDIEDHAEITIEANPGTLDLSIAKDLHFMGFNRLSMGLQAWQNPLLKRLGRIHTQETFLENYKAVRQAGFSNINIDLMMALPTQTLSNWEETLEKTIALKPEHISAYSLIIEEGTPFHNYYEKGIYQETDENLALEMYHLAQEMLLDKGYHQYEISNFAQEGKDSTHNKVYWQTEEYRGFGLSAHSYFQGKRFHNPSDFETYLAAKGNPKKLWQEIESLTHRQQISEFLFMGLRLTSGISETIFTNRFGCTITDVYAEEIAFLLEQNLLIKTPEGYALTKKGVNISNYVFEKFI